MYLKKKKKKNLVRGKEWPEAMDSPGVRKNKTKQKPNKQNHQKDCDGDESVG